MIANPFVVIDDSRPLFRITITIIIDVNGRSEKGSSSFGGRYSLKDVISSDLFKHIDKAYGTAMLKVDAIPAPKGKMPVVLGNNWAGILLHEAVGHGLEGDFNYKHKAQHLVIR